LDKSAEISRKYSPCQNQLVFALFGSCMGIGAKKLTDADKEKRVTMCEWFCNVLENDENFLLSQNRPPG
jgi:hypothetical protein